MQQKIARICFGSSVTLFFTGFLVACYCPGWYATAAGLAAVGSVLGTTRIRIWSLLCLLASLLFTELHHEFEIREAERFRAIQERIDRKTEYSDSVPSDSYQPQ